MANKTLILTIVVLFFSTVTLFASGDPEKKVDPEKEQAKTRKSIVITPPKEQVKQPLKEFSLKDDLLPYDEVEKASPTKATKEAKSNETKQEEDVQSFNFLYYILQSKLSDFITY